MSNFIRANPLGYGPNSPITSPEIEQIDSNLAKAVNGDEGGTYAGDLTWTGEHAFGDEVSFSAAVDFSDTVELGGDTTLAAAATLTLEGEVHLLHNVPVVIHPPSGAPANRECTTRRAGYHNFSVPGNAATPILSLPDWPAVGTLGRLKVSLTSVVAAGAAPHYGLQETFFTCRRLAAGTLAVIATQHVDQTTSTSAIEHDVTVADDSGTDIIISVLAGATNSTCNCTMLVEAIDGPPHAG